MAFRWQADDGPILVVFGSTHQLKKSCQSWIPSEKAVWIRACTSSIRQCLYLTVWIQIKLVTFLTGLRSWSKLITLYLYMYLAGKSYACLSVMYFLFFSSFKIKDCTPSRLAPVLKTIFHQCVISNTVKTLYNVTLYNRIFNIQYKIAGNGSVSIKIPSL